MREDEGAYKINQSIDHLFSKEKTIINRYNEIKLTRH